MTRNATTIGRPTSHIDGTRLKALRKESNLSRLALARKVYDLAGKGAATPEVMKNSAGRWENNGTVALDMVEHLAAALGTSVAVLQGARPDPAPNRIDEMENHLNTLIAKGPSSTLAKALENYKDESAPTEELAIHISSRLEAAQLSQDQEEFKKLAALTGYSTHELNQPTSHQGFWMFIGTERSEILRGVLSVLREVRTEIQEFLASLPESDAYVTFKQVDHWFRITIHHAPISPWVRTLRFARCQPNERGLQWCSPTWRDKFLLDDMPQEFYSYANFVTGFDGVLVPTDCTRLRFAITQNPGAEEFDKWGMDAKRQVVARTAGSLAELHPETLESFKQDGFAHDLVIKRLATDLWEATQPWLADWPLECWSYRPAATRIDILLDVPFRLWANSTVPPRLGNRLSVRLVEESADGTVKPAPWRQKSVELIAEGLEKSRQAALQSQAQSPPHPPVA